MRPRALWILALLLLAAPHAAIAQEGWGGTIDVGATSDGAPIEKGNLTPGAPVTLIGNITVPDRANTTWRVFMNATLDGAPIEDLPDQARPVESNRSTSFAAQFAAPNTTGPHEIAYTVTVQAMNTSQAASGNASDGNQTGNQTQENQTATWETVATQQQAIGFTVAPLEAPPTPGLPWAWIIGVGAVVVAGGSAAYWWRNRDVQIRGQARSQAMQDLESESFEQPSRQEPEVHPQLKILQARADDVKRMIELAKERHERGDLTEHQYETIRDRKEAELEEIQEEMDEYREG